MGFKGIKNTNEAQEYHGQQLMQSAKDNRSTQIRTRRQGQNYTGKRYQNKSIKV